MPRKKKDKNNHDLEPQKSSAAQFLTYVASTGANSEKYEVRYEDENIWMSQKMLAQVYGVDLRTISYHITKIFKDAELGECAVIQKYWITADDGKKYSVSHYNLQVIIALGFKIDNERAVQFRKWANRIVGDYTIRGYVMDKERFKNGSPLSNEYFEHLLEDIREIRLSERKFYQKVTDLYATALDYDRTALRTRRFFASVQNKMHRAVNGLSAAQIIYSRADADKEHMGLTTWKNAPDGRILKTDVGIAKNYLEEKQIRRLERAVTGYFDYIEDLIERENTFTMEEFEGSVNEFLAFRRYDILPDNGKISHKRALEKAYSEYEEFNKTQKIISDFDREIKRLEGIERE